MIVLGRHLCGLACVLLTLCAEQGGASLPACCHDTCVCVSVGLMPGAGHHWKHNLGCALFRQLACNSSVVGNWEKKHAFFSMVGLEVCRPHAGNRGIFSNVYCQICNFSLWSFGLAA